MAVTILAPAPEIPKILTIEEQIVREAEIQHVDPTLAVSIAYCEGVNNKGELDSKAKNPTSSASGIFQIIKSTWEESIEQMGLPLDSDVFATTTNIKVGIWLMEKEGTKPWNSSRYCWKF